MSSSRCAFKYLQSSVEWYRQKVYATQTHTDHLQGINRSTTRIVHSDFYKSRLFSVINLLNPHDLGLDSRVKQSRDTFHDALRFTRWSVVPWKRAVVGTSRMGMQMKGDFLQEDTWHHFKLSLQVSECSKTIFSAGNKIVTVAVWSANENYAEPFLNRLHLTTGKFISWQSISRFRRKLHHLHVNFAIFYQGNSDNLRTSCQSCLIESLNK